MSNFLADTDHWDIWLRHAIDEIKNTYGHTVIPKGKSVLKFGTNPSCTQNVFNTLMTLPTGEIAETYVSDNLITHISSSSAGDTDPVLLEGHTISAGGDLTFSVQTVTLNGQNKVALATPVARTSRLKNISDTDWAGDIYVYEDTTIVAGVPSDGSKVHIIGPQADNQSQKCATSFSRIDYALMPRFYASVNERANTSGTIRVRIKDKGGVFRTIRQRGVHSRGGALQGELRPYAIIRPNSDILIDAFPETNGIAMSAGFDVLLCKIV